MAATTGRYMRDLTKQLRTGLKIKNIHVLFYIHVRPAFFDINVCSNKRYDKGLIVSSRYDSKLIRQVGQQGSLNNVTRTALILQ